MVCTRLPAVEGEFQLCLYQNNQDDKEHLALVMGDIERKKNTLVRVHSECFTGDVLGSRRCDCGEQLHQALSRIAQEGEGMLIYLRQEGRGIGLLNKLRAYNLQDEGFDTVEANLALGHQADERDYSIAAHILKDWGLCTIRLMTNNPLKMESLQALGVTITDRVPVQADITPDNLFYLRTKAERMRHLLTL
jgi:3,4-dihydroxy 2-butanone 4-phosphate synthase/GTP cyclohydrolase II